MLNNKSRLNFIGGNGNEVIYSANGGIDAESTY